MIRPIPRVPALRLAGLALCAFALSGCISLLPKSKPAQLYTFVPAPGAAQAMAARAAIGVFRTNGSFQNESADDRLLTVTNGKNAYIADTRWVAPASVLFDQAVSQAFDASPIRLIARGQQGRSAYGLRLDVRNFETRYDKGEKAAPTVVVRIHVALNKADQSPVGEQIFEAKATASDNRVGAIVTAYDKAMAEVIGNLVAWTEKNAV
ncbi:ABC-type transport auxiliary lipoprotein family protein [Phenylobacterium sp.]|uniref:ABC-type transport auxiliary lipoprotein family protein n=1 Tax=Phenylobacterium sp. TaxID=1871053 RepID=UPI00374D118A